MSKHIDSCRDCQDAVYLPQNIESGTLYCMARKDLVLRNSPTPNQIKRSIESLRVSMDAIARMEDSDWKYVLEAIKTELARIQSVQDLKVYERDLAAFLRNEQRQTTRPQHVDATTVRYVIGTVLSALGVIGAKLTGVPYGGGMTLAALAAFTYLTGKKLNTAFKIHDFRLSPTGKARMRDLEYVLHDLSARINLETHETISTDFTRVRED